MNYFRLLLLPFSFLYGCITYVRNLMYDCNILRSTSFPFPVISVGNLSTGGTGKTPHVGFLVQLLRKDKKIAVLSRGYGRKTSGFILALPTSTAAEIGDEPKQFQTKFPDLTVAVCEDRVAGAKALIEARPETELLLLDDAFQHRSIKAGFSILLIDYMDVISKNYMLPTGSLREFSSGAKRADVLIVSKTPYSFTELQQQKALKKLMPLAHQQVYFSYIKYGNPVAPWPHETVANEMEFYKNQQYSFLMLTGIARPKPLISHLNNYCDSLETAIFPDHHDFSQKEIEAFKNRFKKIKNTKKIVLTTEKDAMRLLHFKEDLLNGIPVFYIPIEIGFHSGAEPEFKKTIFSYLAKNLKQ
jgi:tetraacyldisaccharide 4'-kinase